jgi:hypothetical protein
MTEQIDSLRQTIDAANREIERLNATYGTGHRPSFVSTDISLAVAQRDAAVREIERLESIAQNDT